MIFKKKESTQELLGIEAITDYGISTKQGELVFFSVAPTNLSVLPADSIDARINALLNIIKGYDGIEMIATDKRTAEQSPAANIRKCFIFSFPPSFLLRTSGHFVPKYLRPSAFQTAAGAP